MNPWARKGLVASLAIGAMAGIGIAYEKCVVPQEAVWDETNPVHWKQELIPIKIGGEIYLDATSEAVKLWNDQADCDLFEISNNPTIMIIEGTIEVGKESEDWAAGAFVNANTTRGEIVVYRPLMVGTDLSVLHHEMGHILGLAHDRALTMKPIVEEKIGGKQELVRASDKDIDALNARYCD